MPYKLQTIIDLYNLFIAKLSGRAKWAGLVQQSSGDIFISPSDIAVESCAQIRESYRPILKKFGVEFDQFFWGSIKDEDAATLYELILQRKPQVAYQVGTFVGYSALIIAHALRRNGQGLITALDPEVPHRTFINPVDVARDAALNMGLNEQIRFVRGWHACPMGDDYSESLKQTIPIAGTEWVQSELIDFAFIDGDHSVSATIADFMLLKDSISVGGVVIFHDVFSWPTVAHALSIILDDIHHYRKGTRAYFKLDTKPGPDGLAALARIASSFQPLCKIIVRSSDTHHSIGNALIEIPAVGFTHTTNPSDGSVYIFKELGFEMELKVNYPGYEPYYGPLGVNTNGTYVEHVINLQTDHLNPNL